MTVRKVFRQSLTVLAIVAITGFLAAVFGEIYIRSAIPQHDAPRYFLSGGPYQFQLKPNFHQTYRFGKSAVMEVDTNSLGLRDQQHDFTAPFAGKTLVLAGDSFVFGHGVNVPDRLDTFLCGLMDQQDKCRIVNTGVPGWGTLQETRFVTDHLDIFHPDAVVLVFCGNDPDDDTQFLNSTGMYVGNTKLHNFPGKEFLRNHSHLYRFLLYRATLLRHDLTLRDREKQGEKLVLDTQTAEPISPQDWERTLDEIRQFHDNLRADNPRAVLFVTASNPLQQDISRHLASLDNGSTLRFIDLAPACSSLKPEQMHLGFDQHWSPLMHKTAAQAIYEALKNTNFLN
jgi:hypothetical protein